MSRSLAYCASSTMPAEVCACEIQAPTASRKRTVIKLRSVLEIFELDARASARFHSSCSVGTLTVAVFSPESRSCSVATNASGITDFRADASSVAVCLEPARSFTRVRPLWSRVHVLRTESGSTTRQVRKTADAILSVNVRGVSLSAIIKVVVRTVSVCAAR